MGQSWPPAQSGGGGQSERTIKPCMMPAYKVTFRCLTLPGGRDTRGSTDGEDRTIHICE